MEKKYLVIGTFDLLHSGHVNLLYRASLRGELHVLVTSDNLNIKNSNKEDLFLNEKQRLNLIERLVFVKKASIIDSENISYISDYINKENISGIIYGSDYSGDKSKKKFADDNNIEFIILDRTNSISSTELRQNIWENIK